MSKAAYRSLVWTLPLTLALGCATNSSDRRVSRAEMFESMPAAAMTATSDRPAQRVYPEQPINGIITPSMAPPAGRPKRIGRLPKTFAEHSLRIAR